MSIHKAEALWKGNLKEGQGNIKLTKSNFECSYSFPSRFEDGQGCSPEELIAGAHSGCFSMALAHGLSEAGYSPEWIRTIANVSLEKAGNGFEIGKINLATQVQVEDIELDDFMKIAETTQKECPVSKALLGVEIQLNAELVKDSG
jgi:osmotically inducible protein OsmC